MTGGAGPRFTATCCFYLGCLSIEENAKTFGVSKNCSSNYDLVSNSLSNWPAAVQYVSVLFLNKLLYLVGSDEEEESISLSRFFSAVATCCSVHARGSGSTDRRPTTATTTPA